jgi:hypothetical protein
MEQYHTYSALILTVLLYIYSLFPLCCLKEGSCQSTFGVECNCCKIRGPDVSFVALSTTYTSPVAQIKTLHLEKDSDKAIILLMMKLHAVFAKNKFNRHISQTNAPMKGTVQRDVSINMTHTACEKYYHKNHAEDFNDVHPLYSGSSPPVA